MSIDAEVVALDSAFELDPDITRESLRELVIGYEKKNFNRITRFDKVFPDYELRFTAPGRYDEILHHIYDHKYYVNMNYQEEIPFEEAMKSWYHHVFTPIIRVIREQRLLNRFAGRTEADLYVWLVKHWDQLKRSHGGDFPLGAAAADFSGRFGKSLWNQIAELWERRKANRRRKRLIARGKITEEDLD
jgi:hypothetical protein